MTVQNHRQQYQKLKLNNKTTINTKIICGILLKKPILYKIVFHHKKQMKQQNVPFKQIYG